MSATVLACKANELESSLVLLGDEGMLQDTVVAVGASLLQRRYEDGSRLLILPALGGYDRDSLLPHARLMRRRGRRLLYLERNRLGRLPLDLFYRKRWDPRSGGTPVVGVEARVTHRFFNPTRVLPVQLDGRTVLVIGDVQALFAPDLSKALAAVENTTDMMWADDPDHFDAAWHASIFSAGLQARTRLGAPPVILGP